MKFCIRCHREKAPEEFHRHPRMKDGRLNKCAACVRECVDEWRAKNPGCRAVEYARGQGAERADRGLRRRPNGAGKCPDARRRASVKHTAKRRVQLTQRAFSELDELVFSEAAALRSLRAEMTGGAWHIDHTVPLNHRNACGLHNAFNVQVVPAAWNQRKNREHTGRWLG